MLKVDWCSREAAKFACENWHYSQSLPVGKLVTVGAWEDGKFIGCIVFGHGANKNIGSPYGLDQTQCVELVRVALTNHATPVSRVGAIAIKFLKKQSPGLRLLVSYTDTGQGHHGGIYQAMNWTYVGVSKGDDEVFFRGEWQHKKTVSSIRGTITGLKTRKKAHKHVYLFPLDDQMRAQVLPLAQPYPKRADQSGRSSDNAAPAPTGEGSASLTRPLQVHLSTEPHKEGER
jgi:hypothetical protein